MIKIGLYASSSDEAAVIRRLLTVYSIRHSWADLEVDILESPELYQGADILIADVAAPSTVEALKTIRTRDAALLIFPIAGPEVPPTSYVCPQIMPCGLFWRPITGPSAEPVVEQMMARLHGQSVPQRKDVFRISGKQKVRDIPYEQILYFEARDKKLVLRMATQELVFSGTLSQLESELPSDFLRCHKSFLVHRGHILSVDRTNSLIVLDDQEEVPISRSYKKSFWEGYRGNDTARDDHQHPSVTDLHADLG